MGGRGDEGWPGRINLEGANESYCIFFASFSIVPSQQLFFLCSQLTPYLVFYTSREIIILLLLNTRKDNLYDT